MEMKMKKITPISDWFFLAHEIIQIDPDDPEMKVLLEAWLMQRYRFMAAFERQDAGPDPFQGLWAYGIYAVNSELSPWHCSWWMSPGRSYHTHH